tara:strand:- start:50 stop:229 length:180 start_codon:yes stop_codon:yes gene_type:complete
MNNTKETFDLKITSSYNAWKDELLDEEYAHLFQGKLKIIRLNVCLNIVNLKNGFFLLKK